MRASRDTVAIGLSFTSDWLRNWREFFNQSQSEVKQNQSKTRITFDTHLKTALVILFFRSALKLGCGVFVFVVTWILLGQNSEETVDD